MRCLILNSIPFADWQRSTRTEPVKGTLRLPHNLAFALIRHTVKCGVALDRTRTIIGLGHQEKGMFRQKGKCYFG